MITVTTYEAKTHFSKLLARAQKGEEILILKRKQPAAKLVGVETKSPELSARPVGTPSSAPVKYSKKAFAPLTSKELEAWGLL